MPSNVDETAAPTAGDEMDAQGAVDAAALGDAEATASDEGQDAPEEGTTEDTQQPEEASVAAAQEPAEASEPGEDGADDRAADADEPSDAEPDAEARLEPDRPPPPAAPLTPTTAPAAAVSREEEFEEDGRADQALDFVVDMLTTMRMDCTVDLMENSKADPASDIRIEVSGRDSDRLIGKKGQTLSAMQFLVNRVVNRPSLPRRHILIDAGGYRARREHALSAMARRLGKQAVAEGKIITFEPMSAQDRRVVHLALATFSGVVTKSEGKGATRRVQIIPVRE